MKKNQLHGASRTRTYQSWQSMLSRCYNKDSTVYRFYGGRGITVCKRWFVYTNFRTDMGERPSGLTLDRKNSNGNYEQSNCRWADKKTQTRNRHATKLTLEIAVEIVKRKFAGEKTSTLAAEFGVANRTIQHVFGGTNWPEALATIKSRRQAPDVGKMRSLDEQASQS